jgi:hypothetical protein
MSTSTGRLCECGCGATTQESRNGTPNRYLHGHNRRGTSNPDGFINQGHRYVRVNGVTRALHRVVAERTLGRPLQPDEIVHHIDGDPLNNAPSNLTVVSRQQHFLLHMIKETAKPWSEDEVARAVELYLSGMSIDAAAQMIGRSYYATRRLLNKKEVLRTGAATRALRAAPQDASAGGLPLAA